MQFHDSTRIPQLSRRWDPQDVDWLFFDWSEIANGSTITGSVWHFPSGWQVNQSMAGVRVSDGDRYTSASAHACAVLLETDHTQGRHQISNTVAFSDGRTFNRAVNVVVGDI